MNESKTQLEAELAKPEVYSDKQRFQSAENAYQKAAQEWESTNRRYEQVFERLMQLQDNA